MAETGVCYAGEMLAAHAGRAQSSGVSVIARVRAMHADGIRLAEMVRARRLTDGYSVRWHVSLVAGADRLAPIPQRSVAAGAVTDGAGVEYQVLSADRRELLGGHLEIDVRDQRGNMVETRDCVTGRAVSNLLPVPGHPNR